VQPAAGEMPGLPRTLMRALVAMPLRCSSAVLVFTLLPSSALRVALLLVNLAPSAALAAPAEAAIAQARAVGFGGPGPGARGTETGPGWLISSFC
jgi:hypothetical protein